MLTYPSSWAPPSTFFYMGNMSYLVLSKKALRSCLPPPRLTGPYHLSRNTSPTLGSRSLPQASTPFLVTTVREIVAAGRSRQNHSMQHQPSMLQVAGNWRLRRLVEQDVNEHAEDEIRTVVRRVRTLFDRESSEQAKRNAQASLFVDYYTHSFKKLSAILSADAKKSKLMRTAC